ncbi:MAG: type VI secretion system tube protein TssD, partial [Bacteroides sp.]
MAENMTPVQLSVKDFEVREVMMIDYQFSQTIDIEGQISGIPRGGRISIRVKAMNDGNNQLLQWMLSPNDPRDMKVTF